MNTMASSLLQHKSFCEWVPFLIQSPKTIFRIGATLLLICFSLNTYAAIKTWKGTTSSNWNVASNWNPAAVPVAGDDVNLSGAIPPNMPKILSGTVARAGSVYIGFNLILTIESGGELEIDGTQFASLDVAGILDNFGILRIKRADFHCIDNIGTITNNHIILLGQATSSPYACKEEGIRNNGSGQFINNSTGQLTIQRTGNNGILLFTGSPLFRNYGQITVRETGINPATANTADGIDVRAGNFINETTGNILITKTQANGFFCRESGATTNKGILTIRNTGLTTAEEVKEGLSNNTFFENTATGQISIDSTGNNGIFSQGVFTNGGQISIGTLAANSITTNGIANIGNFTNKTGATLTIKNTGRAGLTHLSFGSLFLNESGANISVNNTTLDGFLTFGFGTVENRGTIQIGNTGPIGTIGVVNNCTFVNQPGATLSIQQTTGSGILNEKTTPSIPVAFKNGGQLTIGNLSSAGSTVPGIQNLAPCSFENLFCGQITTYQKIVNQGTFLNDAFIQLLGTAANSNSSTFTNDGLIEDPNGLFNGVSLTNNDFIVVSAGGACVINNVLHKGTGTNVTIGSTWYKQPNLTQPAGAYNQATNTFTVFDLALGVHTLYFSATDNFTGCIKTIPVKITALSDNTLPTAVCRNVTLDLNQNGAASLAAAQVNNVSYDACGIASISINNATFNCSNTGDNPVTLTVTDHAGNSGTCTATIKVRDVSAPTGTCPATQTLVLGASCSAVLPDYRSLAAYTDNCGTVTLSQQPPPGTIVSGAGDLFVSINARDASDNLTFCIFTVKKVDNTYATYSNPVNATLVLDASCSAVLPDYRSQIEATATDNCGIAAVVQIPSGGTVVSGAGNEIVFVRVIDVNGNSSNSYFVVNMVDNIPPTIVCPGIQTLELGADCSATLPDYRQLATAGDNCGVPTIVQSPAPGTIVSGAGNTTVALTVTDVNGLTNSCTFTVTKMDNTPPTVVCKTNTVFLNPTGNYTFLAADVFNAAASSDNCSGVLTVTNISPATVSCTQLGMTIPVTVTVQDAAGNSATCNAQITVQEGTALPESWSSNNVGSANGSGEYKPCTTPTGHFTVSATGFSTSSVDVLHLISRQLCGNGEIIARVTNLSGGGWAGVTLRESLAPGSKLVALKTQGSNNMRRMIRTTTNGAVNNLNLFRQHTWLRLVRNGSNFVGYTSTNGVIWDFAFSTTVTMTGCIYVGLFAESINNAVTTTATFDHVQIIGGVLPLIQAPQTPVAASNLSPEVYPNPTTGEVNIDLSGYANPVGTVKTFDAYGKLLIKNQLDGSALFRTKLDGNDGVYFLSIEVEGEAPVTKRVVVAH